MRGASAWLAAAAASIALVASAEEVRLLVMDLPYARVWDATLRALDGYPIVRAMEGTVETGPRERPPHAGEPGFARVTERATVRVEALAERLTRVTVRVEAEGLRDGTWGPVADTGPAARAILGRLRDAASQAP